MTGTRCSSADFTIVLRTPTMKMSDPAIKPQPGLRPNSCDRRLNLGDTPNVDCLYLDRG